MLYFLVAIFTHAACPSNSTCTHIVHVKHLSLFLSELLFYFYFKYILLTQLYYNYKCIVFHFPSFLWQDQSLPTISSFRPPLLNKHCNFGTGLKLKTENFSCSLAELFSSLMRPSNSTNKQSIFNTFGEISIKLADQSKLTMSGMWQAPRTISQPVRSRNSQSPPNLDQNQRGSLSLVLDIDEDTKVGGWVEVQKSKPNLTNWAISLADTPAGELGWVVSVGGKSEGKSKRFQFESFLSFDLGGKAKLQPGVVLMMDANGRNRVPSFVFRSSWSM